MVRCWVERNGLMLGQRVWFDARLKVCGISNRQVIGCKKIIWWERKKEILTGAKKKDGNKEFTPHQKIYFGRNNLALYITTSLYY